MGAITATIPKSIIIPYNNALISIFQVFFEKNKFF